MDESSHEEEKFREWAARVENCIAKKDYQLRHSCERLVYWAHRISDTNPTRYKEVIRETEFSLISRSIPIIYHHYYTQYLLSAKKHGKLTKARQDKIASFVYQFTLFLVPLAEEINDQKFLKEKIKDFMIGYVQDLLRDLTNIDAHEIDQLLVLTLKAEKQGIPNSRLARKSVEKEIINRQLQDEARNDLNEGESKHVEFKEEIPEDDFTIAKEIAAFASTEGGRMYFGVRNNGDPVGVVEEGTSWFDELQQRIDKIADDSVKPGLLVSIKRFMAGRKTIVQITVQKGSEPVYFARNVPYIRGLTRSRPATPSDVKNLHLIYFTKQKTLRQKSVRASENS